jgi:hypothetical protein
MLIDWFAEALPIDELRLSLTRVPDLYGRWREQNGKIPARAAGDFCRCGGSLMLRMSRKSRTAGGKGLSSAT